MPFQLELDSLMRCPICFDYFSTAMILPNCSHNYCSLCIRQYFQFKTQCPTCGMAAADPDLRNNRILDSIVKQFLELRQGLIKESQLVSLSSGNKMLSLLHEKPTRQGSSDTTTLSTVSVKSPLTTAKSFSTSKDSSHTLFENPIGKSKKPSKKILPSGNEIEIIDDEVPHVQEDGTKTSINGKICIRPATVELSVQLSKRIYEAKSVNVKTVGMCDQRETASVPVSPAERNAFTPSPASSSKKVACPVCGVPVKECYVNLHLDRCLQQDDRQKTVTKRKPLTKLVYNLMSDKELKKKLKELGLSVQGSRQILIKRHREFLMFYNADGDSLNPKPLTVLVREFEKMDTMKNQMSKRTSELSVAVKKGSKAEEIRKAQTQYVKKHNSQYSKLMADVKKRLAETRCTRLSARNNNDGNVEMNNTAAEKLPVSEDVHPPSRCDVQTGMADSPVSEHLSSDENGSRITPDVVNHSALKSASQNVTGLKAVCVMSKQSSSPENEHGGSTSIKEGLISASVIGHDKIKVENDSATNDIPSNCETNKLHMQVTVSVASSENGIKNDGTFTTSLIVELKDKRGFSEHKEVNRKSTPSKDIQLTNNQMDSQVMSTAVDKSFESPRRSSPRKRLFSPNTAGIACDVATPASGHNSPGQTVVENSDPEDDDEISFMDAITESIDLFGSESITNNSVVSKELWPALSQNSVSTSCDLFSQSDPETHKSRNGQKQDDTMDSDSDILECVNDNEMQVPSDIGISTRGQNAKSREPTLRRSTRCKKRMSEHVLENATKRKRRK